MLGLPLASWSQRVVALAVDLVAAGFLCAALVAAVSTPDVHSLPGGGYQVVWTSGTVRATLLFFLLLTAYFTFTNGSGAGQTVGKALVGIAVRDAAGGGQIGAARGLARSAVTGALWYLAIVPWVLDGLWSLWDPRRQTLHDRAAGSVVVRVR